MMIATLIVWYHIVSHVAIWFCDYTQIVPLLDFVARPDGSASDPTNLEPLELIYAGITAMSFGSVAVAYILAVMNRFDVTIRGAAALSAAFHGMWAVHMVWRWQVWSAMMHPDGTMTPGFFLFSHILWTASSMALLFMDTSVEKSAPNSSEEKKSH
jgi:hypothetical protein